MTNLNEQEILDNIRYLVVRNAEELSIMYKTYLRKTKNEENDTKINILTLGFFNVFSRVMLFVIDNKYNKNKTLEWIKDGGLSAKTKSGKVYKNYKFKFNTLSAESLYQYYLLQNELKLFLVKNRNISASNFVKFFEEPEFCGRGLRHIAPTKILTLKQEVSKEEIKTTLSVCEEKMQEVSNISPIESYLDNLTFIGYSENGQPVYSKNGSFYAFLEDGKTRASGRIYGIGEDNEPKEYLEPKGYETHPHAEEKDV